MFLRLWSYPIPLVAFQKRWKQSMTERGDRHRYWLNDLPRTLVKLAWCPFALSLPRDWLLLAGYLKMHPPVLSASREKETRNLRRLNSQGNPWRQIFLTRTADPFFPLVERDGYKRWWCLGCRLTSWRGKDKSVRLSLKRRRIIAGLLFQTNYLIFLNEMKVNQDGGLFFSWLVEFLFAALLIDYSTHSSAFRTTRNSGVSARELFNFTRRGKILFKLKYKFYNYCENPQMEFIY